MTFLSLHHVPHIVRAIQERYPVVCPWGVEILLMRFLFSDHPSLHSCLSVPAILAPIDSHRYRTIAAIEHIAQEWRIIVRRVHVQEKYSADVEHLVALARQFQVHTQTPGFDTNRRARLAAGRVLSQLERACAVLKATVDNDPSIAHKREVRIIMDRKLMQLRSLLPHPPKVRFGNTEIHELQESEDRAAKSDHWQYVDERLELNKVGLYAEQAEEAADRATSSISSKDIMQAAVQAVRAAAKASKCAHNACLKVQEAAQKI
jgi:hypothetical protein